MNPVLNPWKEASTLILVAKASNLQRLGSHMESTTITSTVRDQTADLDQLNLSSDLSDKARKRLTRVLELINQTDYRIMMVKRSSLSSFMASAYVFPGRWMCVCSAAAVHCGRLLAIACGPAVLSIEIWSNRKIVNPQPKLTPRSLSSI